MRTYECGEDLTSHQLAKWLLTQPDRPTVEVSGGPGIHVVVNDKAVAFETDTYGFIIEDPDEVASYDARQRLVLQPVEIHYVCDVQPDDEEGLQSFEFDTQAELEAFKHGVEAFGTWEMHEGNHEWSAHATLEEAKRHRAELLT